MKLIDNTGLSYLISKIKTMIGLKADKTYVDNKVKTDVPVGAKFTDTVYTHPASHPASMITGLPTSLPASGGNADTVGGFTVGVNVPANAKFTDTNTITTINGKTGAISKDDIVALGIPASDTNTTYTEITTAEIDAGTSTTRRTITGRRVKYILDKVTTLLSDKVKTDVPSGAKFTDTVYSHPSSHPASMITESSTKRFVSDSEKSTWNSKSDTDTITTINGKTGAISKADIVALGIPSSDTDTTYTEITTAEIDAGTASTRRTISGRRVQAIVDKAVSSVSGFAPISHTHSASNINSGTLSYLRIPRGTTSTTVATGNHTHSSFSSLTLTGNLDVGGEIDAEDILLEGKSVAANLSLINFSSSVSRISGVTGLVAYKVGRMYFLSFSYKPTQTGFAVGVVSGIPSAYLPGAAIAGSVATASDHIDANRGITAVMGKTGNVSIATETPPYYSMVFTFLWIV